MTTKVSPPPADLNSFLGRKWLESLTRQTEDVSAIANLQFLLLAVSGSLPNARRLLGSANISLTDGGAGSNLVLNLINTGVTAGTYTKVTVDVKGRITAATAASTTDITEGINLYFTNARARSALSGTTNQVNYNSGTGVFSTPQDIHTAASPTFTALALKAGSSSGNVAKVGGTIFDHFVDAGNGTTVETDLYSDTLLANTFAVNGEKVFAEYGGTLLGHATATRQLKVYFAGTVLLDTGALAVLANATFEVRVRLIRVSSTVVRYTVTIETSDTSLSIYNAVGELTGLTLSGTNILKITGQAAGVGAATDDIVAKMGSVDWKAAA